MIFVIFQELQIQVEKKFIVLYVQNYIMNHTHKKIDVFVVEPQLDFLIKRGKRNELVSD